MATIIYIQAPVLAYIVSCTHKHIVVTLNEVYIYKENSSKCALNLTGSVRFSCNSAQKWHLGCNLYSMQLAIEGYNNSSVHILFNPAYSMQRILESVNIGIILHLILYLSYHNTISVPQRSPGPQMQGREIMLSFQLLCITVWIIACSAFKSNLFHSNSMSHMYHVCICCPSLRFEYLTFQPSLLVWWFQFWWCSSSSHWWEEWWQW